MHIMSTNFAKTLIWKHEYDVKVWRHKQRTPNANDHHMPLNEKPPMKIFCVRHSPKYISLQLPYSGSVSNIIRQEFSSFIRHKAVVNVKLRCFQNTRNLQSWFLIKDRQALLNRFNVAYRLTCSCGPSYIGITQRNLLNRIEEHRTPLSSSVCRHLQANPDHI